MKSIADRVRYLRGALSATQQEFAGLVGVSQPTIARWEGLCAVGDSGLSVDSVDAIAIACGITRGQFWADDFPRSLPPHLNGGKR